MPMAAPIPLDIDLCHQLDDLVESLTTSGQPQLDADKLKQLKKICKLSDEYVKKCFHALMIQLEKGHSEIRVSTLQLCDELFMRSHCFRDLLLQDFQYFLELTLETNGDFPLPPPKQAAKTLKAKGGELVHKWNEKFGEIYKKLSLGYHFLKSCKHINFSDLEMRSVAERQRAENRTSRTAGQHRAKLGKTLDEMHEGIAEIKSCLTQADNCIDLLLPSLDNFDIQGIKSPEVYPKSVSRPRHINKSTKRKHSHRSSTDSGHVVPTKIAISIKTEPGTPNPSYLSMLSECCDENKQADRPLTDAKTDRSSAKGAQKESDPIDTKPSLAELATAMHQYQQQKHSSEFFDQTDPEDAHDPIEAVAGTSAPSELFAGEEEELQEDNIVQGHGLGSQLYSIDIPLAQDGVPITETPDNQDIIHTLLDCSRLASTKYSPLVTRWLEVLGKTGAKAEDIKKAVDIKQKLKRFTAKMQKLKVKRMIKKPPVDKVRDRVAGEDSSDDDDFEEVSTKEGYEADIPAELREMPPIVSKGPKPRTNPDWVLSETVNKDDGDPTTAKSTLRVLKRKLDEKKLLDVKGSVEPRVKLEKPLELTDPLVSAGASTSQGNSAPAVPFGMDLYHWGKEIETPLMVRYDSEHRFMPVTNGADVVDYNALASMKSRVINFTGSFEPVKWKCRAPMSNGTLCQRMDRVKCPFHGKIVARTAVGEPSNDDDFLRLQREAEIKRESQRPDWDDPAFQAELKAATGVDLQRKGQKKGKGKQAKQRPKKYPGLTDIKKVHDTARHRLEGKILNQSAIRRVASAMDCIDEKKRKDKFGNSFNYVHRLKK